ncbi:chemotaxis protein [Photobacterium proteolyticum]|uniref:Chemotaxis protein n=1 Tax=Photobacterium proteolyticum TaxID=1903952 RepID=A0A1Q9GFS6_9GAMM|nr:CHASE3 domain-containing protein [Photobacterium proteolyticum]OLQ73299.1 chemotaxis protein [Photobacterium proteolyticum]
MNLSNMSIRNKLLLGNCATIIVLLVLFSIVWNSIQTMSSTSKMVEHTYRVIEHSNGLVNAMVDQETGLRGFSIGGQDDYLEPYIAGKNKFLNHLKTVVELTSDNPSQQERFAAIAKDAKAWQAYADGIIALRENIREGEKYHRQLQDLIASGIGKQKMDGLRAEIANGDFGYTGDEILAAVINMETGLRGFMLNRKEEFLEPYNTGRRDLARLLPPIKHTMLSRNVNEWVNNYAEAAIALVRNVNQFKLIDDLYNVVSQKQGKTYMDGLREKVATVVRIEADLMSKRKASSEDASSLATLVIIAGGLITVVMSFGCGIVISNSISRPIGEAVDAANQLAKGDLTIRVKRGGKNEVGILLSAIQTTADSLKGIIGNITDASKRLGDASEHLTTITTNTSRGAQEQQHMTDQVAVAMNQMSISVQEVAQNAVKAAQFANDAHSEAQTGIEIVQGTIESISKLDDEISLTSSRLGELAQEADNIGGILDVIRGIADQTNLLALNAAIEAARAGEQGRGFAVVADEVRGLAKRTQDSTTEIQELIERLQQGTHDVVASMEKSSDFVKASVVDAGKSGDAFNVITEAIAKINDMNTQSANASEEQSVTTEEINKNVVNVNKISEQSAVEAARTVESSKELSELSMTLQGIVGQFRGE